MVSFNFYLDKPFKSGHTKEIQYLKREGLPYHKYYYPNPTPIYLWVTFNKKQKFKLHSGEKIKPKDWNFTSKEVKSNALGALEINDYLIDFKREVVHRYREIIKTDPDISYEDLKELLKNKKGNQSPAFEAKKTALEHYSEFMELKELEVKEITMKKYRTLQKVLGEFLEDGNKYFGIKVRCEHINVDFYKRFCKYLIDARQLKNDTIAKYIECLKVFMRYSHKKGFHECMDYEEFSIKREKKDIVWLDNNELKAIEELELEPNSTINNIRLAFLYQTYTGQRFGDVKALKRKHLRFLDDGGIEWHLYQEKGNKTKKVVIPLLPTAEKIARKFCHPNDPIEKLVFPSISNVHTNKYLKKIGRLAGIDEITTIVSYSGKNKIEECGPKYEFITTHTARRSFVCVSFERGLDLTMIQNFTGHADQKIIERYYLQVSERAKREALFNAWK
ncbi:MAG: tyrosine-type recombinase/integrase [Cyclobacteriaceae bacterium]